MMRVQWFTFVLSLFGVSCIPGDPGWHYRAPGGTPVQADGLRYEISGPRDLGVRVYASAFAGSLHAEVTLTNSGTKALDLASPHLVVTDARGVSLREQYPGKLSCSTQTRTNSGAIPPGVACTLSSRVQIQPLVGVLFLERPNPDLRTISVAVASGGPASAPRIEVPLVWNR
jgi:hypothetical protein